jgi:hypothetical protein
MRYWRNRKLEIKRKKRIERLMQKFDLLGHREKIGRVWGWNARRRTVNSLARGGVS